MIQALFDSTTLPLLQQVAQFAERRQEVLAGNLANISTPDYRTRDLPLEAFHEALKKAVAAHQVPDAEELQWSFQTASAPRGASEKPLPLDVFQASTLSAAGLTFQDGNNRSIEREVMEMTKNSLLQSAAVELMMAQMSRLQAVISERA